MQSEVCMDNEIKNAARIDSGKNYWCSWATQGSLGRIRYEERARNGNNETVDISVANPSRFEMNEEIVFGKGGFAEQFPELRGELYLLLDDGWDVPYDVTTDKGIDAFGSVIPDSERFPSFKGTPAERLKAMNEKARSMGWLGLGLWISPQMCGEGHMKHFDLERELHKSYWRERILWSKQADIRYWKIDWGNFGRGNVIEYRRMMSTLKNELYPELIMEHSSGGAPVNGYPNAGKFRYADNEGLARESMQMCEYSDVFRSYDITDDMLGDTTTLDRLAFLLSFSPCLVNCEDTLYIGAALGCALGIMRSHYGKDFLRMNRRLDEITAALRWQRQAPSFVGGELKVSDDLLADRAFFTPDDTWYKEIHDRLVEQDAPAVMARNTELPEVLRSERMPFVIASKNPTGAYSIAAVKRKEFLENTEPARVSCNIEDAKKIGIFGEFECIELSSHGEIRKVCASSLIGDKEADISLEALKNGKVVLTRDILEGFNCSSDESENAVMISLEF